MENFIKQNILDAFSRCYGLKDLIHSNNPKTFKAAITALSTQACVRETYLMQHLNELLTL